MELDSDLPITRKTKLAEIKKEMADYKSTRDVSVNEMYVCDRPPIGSPWWSLINSYKSGLPKIYPYNLWYPRVESIVTYYTDVFCLLLHCNLNFVME